MADDKRDDEAARKARNDAIRRARDRQSAGTDPAAADDTTTDPADAADASDPNYVAFIDRKMKEGKKP